MPPLIYVENVHFDLFNQYLCTGDHIQSDLDIYQPYIYTYINLVGSFTNKLLNQIDFHKGNGGGIIFSTCYAKGIKIMKTSYENV